MNWKLFLTQLRRIRICHQRVVWLRIRLHTLLRHHRTHLTHIPTLIQVLRLVQGLVLFQITHRHTLRLPRPTNIPTRAVSTRPLGRTTIRPMARPLISAPAVCTGATGQEHTLGRPNNLRLTCVTAR